MFERYTEKLRRVIFFARYEASQLGSSSIDTEHLLLGLMREAHDLVLRFHLPADSIRAQIDQATVIREQVTTSVDLPLSVESKHVLFYASEEADALGHKHIGTEHLFLGLLREEKGLSAELLREAGIRLRDVRKQLKQSPGEPVKEERVLYPGIHHIPIVEFLENGEPLSAVPFIRSLLPHSGDEVLLRSEEGTTRAYLVDKVRFIVLDSLQQLDKVQVFVTSIPSP